MRVRSVLFACLLSTLLLTSLPLGGCGEEATEAVLCTSLANKICSKWFDCWPVISAALFYTYDDCRDVVRVNCNNSEWLHGCDLDNADLLECEQLVDDSPCGSLPDSCDRMLDCYQ